MIDNNSLVLLIIYINIQKLLQKAGILRQYHAALPDIIILKNFSEIMKHYFTLLDLNI